MKTLPALIFACLISSMICSCNTLKEVSLIYNTDVEPTRVNLKDKSILLTPIVHYGQKEFFDKLTDSIGVWKSQGYRVYYEEINIGPHERNIPFQEYEVIFRKFRKMTGGTPTRESYAELSESFEGGIPQPLYPDLGVDSTDFNADVTVKEFVEEYERLYGQVSLSTCDNETPLDAPFACEPLKNDMGPVIDDFRNKMLVKQLVRAQDKKIVVLYGAIHIKPLAKAIKKIG